MINKLEFEIGQIKGFELVIVNNAYHCHTLLLLNSKK